MTSSQSAQRAKKFGVAKVNFQRWLDTQPPPPNVKFRITTKGYGQFLFRTDPQEYNRLYKLWRRKKLENMGVEEWDGK